MNVRGPTSAIPVLTQASGMFNAMRYLSVLLVEVVQAFRMARLVEAGDLLEDDLSSHLSARGRAQLRADPLFATLLVPVAVPDVPGDGMPQAFVGASAGEKAKR
jgi:hypothetical protein